MTTLFEPLSATNIRWRHGKISNHECGHYVSNVLLNRTFRFIQLFVVAILFSIFVGCGIGERNFGSGANQIVAEWDESQQTLTVSGYSKDIGSVEIHDASDTAESHLLGSAIVDSSGQWRANSSVAACTLHIRYPDGTKIVPVNNAPDDCAERSKQPGVSHSRALPTSNLDKATGPATTLAIAPNAIIMKPRQNVSISIGETVVFEGLSIGGDTTGPALYQWTFSGAAPDTTVQNPGPITFNIPGVFEVRLAVVDAAGIADPTPAVRMIHVIDPATGQQPNAEPVPIISSPLVPDGMLTINLGTTVFFSGTANDPAGDTGMQYEWDFGGAFPNQTVAEPGDMTFTQIGTFIVKLYVTNSAGVRSSTPAQIQIDVVDPNPTPAPNPTPIPDPTPTPVPDPTPNPIPTPTPNPVPNPIPNPVPNPVPSPIPVPPPGVFNQAPKGYIVSPRADISVAVGTTVSFRGRGDDPDMSFPLTYSWDFNNIAPAIVNSPSSDGGSVTFTAPGIYRITLVVRDRFGLADPNPPVRTISVSPADATQAHIIRTPEDHARLQVGVPYQLTSYDPPPVPPPPGLPIVPWDTTTYRWEISDITGLMVVVFDDYAPPMFAFNSPGEYNVRLTRTKTSFVNGITTVTDVHHVMVGFGIPQIPNSDLIATPTQDLTVDLANPNLPTLYPGGPPVISFTVQPMVAVAGIVFYWDFDGLAPPTSQMDPGVVPITRTGRFVVTLRVDFPANVIGGNSRTIFSRRVITVIDSRGSQTPLATPKGIINSPQNGMTIRVGSSLVFAGSGFDPLGTGPLSYQWSFGGAAPNINSPYPGAISFNQIGKFPVVLLVSNRFGIHDPNPPVVVITVVP